MVVESTMLPLGTLAPDFKLLNTYPFEGYQSRDDVLGVHGMVVMFLCNHCPFVKHIQSALVACAQHYQSQGIGFVAISSNDVRTYPQDGPEAMMEEAKNNGYVFPYLYDETQEVAHAYQAACTPDFFLFDADKFCVYRGRFDESTPSNGRAIIGTDLKAAIDALLLGQTISTPQYPSVGCSIKWFE